MDWIQLNQDWVQQWYTVHTAVDRSVVWKAVYLVASWATVIVSKVSAEYI